MRFGVALLAMAAAKAVFCQAAYASDLYPQTLVSSGPGLSQGEIVREIDDPHTGARWLLMRNPIFPAGPGCLVLVGGMRIAAPRSEAPEFEQPRPVIHGGDRLIVEENTALVESRLEAVALGPAVVGSPLDVRLKIGGKVERALALGPGRAAFLEEARP